MILHFPYSLDGVPEENIKKAMRLIKQEFHVEWVVTKTNLQTWLDRVDKVDGRDVIGVVDKIKIKRILDLLNKKEKEQSKKEMTGE